MEKLIIVDGKPIEKERVNGHVYIVEREEGLLKIGKSTNPVGRINQISNLGGFEVKNQFISERCGNPYELEAKLHTIFEERNVKGEWFDVPFNEVVNMTEELNFKPIEYKREKSAEEKTRDEELMKSLFPQPEMTMNKNATEEQAKLLDDTADKIFDYLMNKIEDRFYLIPKE